MKRNRNKGKRRRRRTKVFGVVFKPLGLTTNSAIKKEISVKGIKKGRSESFLSVINEAWLL